MLFLFATQIMVESTKIHITKQNIQHFNLQINNSHKKYTQVKSR